MNAYAVYLGAIGWSHADWRGTFYPDDLPEDWLLAYYNTQFRAVYVDYASWSRCTLQELRDWAGETQPAFRFVLEAPAGGDAAAEDLARIPAGASFLLARRDDPRLLWFDAGTDLRALAGEIGQRDKPLYLFSRDADLAGLQRVATLIELLGL